MAVPPGNHRGSDLRRTCSVRRKVRDPRTPGRTARSPVAAGGSCIMRPGSGDDGQQPVCTDRASLPVPFGRGCNSLVSQSEKEIQSRMAYPITPPRGRDKIDPGPEGVAEEGPHRLSFRPSIPFVDSGSCREDAGSSEEKSDVDTRTVSLVAFFDRFFALPYLSRLE
jgi:hypothetical protein